MNPKFLKDSEKKMDNINILKVNNLDDLYTKKSNKSINYIPNIPNNGNNYIDSSFNGRACNNVSNCYVYDSIAN